MVTVDELQNFIENNLYADVPTEKYNELMTDAQSMDLRSFADKHGDFMAEKSDGWTKVSKSMPKTLQERIREEFGNSTKINPFSSKTENEVNEIYREKFSDDVPRELFDRNLKNMSKYWDDNKAAEDYELGKMQRKKEIKEDWGLAKSLLTSDYAKERYINEPETSLFGKEAPSLGKAKDTRTTAIADLGLGLAAGAADIVPSPVYSQVWLGPVLRGARDVMYSGTPYGKETQDIVKDVTSDMGVNAGIDFLRNFRKVGQLARAGKESPAATRLFLEQEIGKTNKGFDTVMNAIRTKSNTDLVKTIDKLPEGELKKKLKPLVTDIQNIDRSKVLLTAAEEKGKGQILSKEWNTPVGKEQITFKEKLLNDINNPERTVITGGEEAAIKKNPTAYFAGGFAVNPNDPFTKKLLLAPELSKTQKIMKNVYKFSPLLESKWSGAALKTGETATGRPGNVKVSDELDKDWYRTNYERDWELGFKPRKKEGEPKWEAFREWYIGKFGREPEEE